MVEETLVIKNKTGLHARPASLLVKKANSFPCSVYLKKDGKEVDAKSILSVLSLGVGEGDTVTIITDGEMEKAALEQLIKLLEEFQD